MAILAECPFCYRKQSVKNRLCSCGEDLIHLKRSKKMKLPAYRAGLPGNEISFLFRVINLKQQPIVDT